MSYSNILLFRMMEIRPVSSPTIILICSNSLSPGLSAIKCFCKSTTFFLITWHQASSQLSSLINSSVMVALISLKHKLSDFGLGLPDESLSIPLKSFFALDNFFCRLFNSCSIFPLKSMEILDADWSPFKPKDESRVPFVRFSIMDSIVVLFSFARFSTTFSLS